MSDELLAIYLAEFAKQIGGPLKSKMHGWFLIFHVMGPGGKTSGAVTFQVCYSKDGRPPAYWNKTIREADHTPATPGPKEPT